MSDSIIPTASVDLLVRMSHNIDFKDKILKILGSSAKVSAVLGSPHAKEYRTFASQLSAARRWMKFLKIIRSTPELLNPAADIQSFAFKGAKPWDFCKLFFGKLEFVADIAQMVAEDVHTLHKGHVWSSGLGLKPINNLGVMEDRAWWFWSLIAAINAFIEMREVRAKYEAASLRLQALNPVTVPAEIELMREEVSVLRIKYLLVLFKLIKFVCEVVDSSIALTPDRVKKSLSPSAFELVSCFAGSLSAVSSLHKLFYNETKSIREGKQ